MIKTLFTTKITKGTKKRKNRISVYILEILVSDYKCSFRFNSYLSWQMKN